MKSNSFHLTLPLLALLLACGSDVTGPRAEDIEITLDRSSYTAMADVPVGSMNRLYHFTVIATIRNRGPVPVGIRMNRLSPPPTVIIDISRPGELSPYASPLDGMAPPFKLVLAPGQSHTDTLRVQGPTTYPGDQVISDSLTQALAGTFQFSYKLVGVTSPSVPLTVVLGN